MVIRHQDAHGEERRRRVVLQHPGKADDPAGDPGERAHLQQHVLVENAPACRLVGHQQDVGRDAQDHDERQGPGDPARRCFAEEAGAASGQRHHSRCDQGERPPKRDRPAGRPEDGVGDGHHDRHHRQGDEHRPDAGDVDDESYGSEAGGDGDEEPLAFTDEVGLLLLEGAQLARVVEVVADVPQGGENVLGADLGGVVVHQRLLVSQADGHLVHAG